MVTQALEQLLKDTSGYGRWTWIYRRPDRAPWAGSLHHRRCRGARCWARSIWTSATS